MSDDAWMEGLLRLQGSAGFGGGGAASERGSEAAGSTEFTAGAALVGGRGQGQEDSMPQALDCQRRQGGQQVSVAGAQ